MIRFIFLFIFWRCSMLSSVIADMLRGGKSPGDYRLYSGAQYLDYLSELSNMVSFHFLFVGLSPELQFLIPASF
jgi:hypothetical protein